MRMIARIRSGRSGSGATSRPPSNRPLSRPAVLAADNDRPRPGFEDWDLWLRLTAAGADFANLPEGLSPLPSAQRLWHGAAAVLTPNGKPPFCAAAVVRGCCAYPFACCRQRGWRR